MSDYSEDDIREVGIMWFTPGDKVIYAPGSPSRSGWHGTVTEGARKRPPEASNATVAVRWEHGPVEYVPPARLILRRSASHELDPVDAEPFDPADCGGVWDGFQVTSDADPGL